MGEIVNVCACDGEHTCDGPSRNDLLKERVSFSEQIDALMAQRQRYARRIEEMYRLACPGCRRKFDSDGAEP